MSEPQREVTFRFLAEPTDMNFHGRVHGGSVMKWIDQASYACAAGWCHTTCVTVYVGGIRFYKPIQVGNVVEIKAQLIHTGRSSMHIAVNVCAIDPVAGDRTKTTSCVTVFSAIDANGRTVQVPAWAPQTADDQALEALAVRLMDLRKGIEEDLIQQTMHEC